MLARVIGVALAAAALAACARGADRPRGDGRLLVMAAVSTSEAMREAGAEYTKITGQEVRYSFAASNVLARQVREGIGADVIVSADEHQLDLLARAGAIDESTRVPLFGNRLVVVVRGTAGLEVTSADGLLRDEVRRVAIGDPAGVPAGVYARGYLERVSLWNRLRGKIVPASSVRAALAAVGHGHADAAFVYRTDLSVGRDVKVAFEIEGPHAPRIVYPAAVITRSPNASSARALVAWLQGDAAAAIFRRHGFAAPPDQ